MDERIMAAITAAVNAYMDSEGSLDEKRFGQRLSPWKMAGRRETMSKHALTGRVNPAKTRLNRFSIF